MGFEPGTFRFLLQRLNPLGHFPQINKQISKVDNISKNLKELIENTSENKETVIDELSKGYKDLIWDKKLYTFNIKKEVESRELHKLETFKASCLNIKLPKSKGYVSAMECPRAHRK